MLWLAISRALDDAAGVPPLPPPVTGALAQLRRLRTALATTPSAQEIAQTQATIDATLADLNRLAGTLAAMSALKPRTESDR